MKHKIIVANWKSNKTIHEAKEWLNNWFINLPQQTEIADKEIIICPPYPIIPILYNLIMNYSDSNSKMLKLGSQDISSFTEGAYTGEVAARLLSEFCAYCIIGHSERRKLFNESNEILASKVSLALQYNLNPIYCVQNMDTVIPDSINILAFEPVWAIGSGKPDTPEDADKVAGFFKKKYGTRFVLYGGSVMPENVAAFTSMEHIDGVLVGGASKDSRKFVQIVKNA